MKAYESGFKRFDRVMTGLIAVSYKGLAKGTGEKPPQRES